MPTENTDMSTDPDITQFAASLSHTQQVEEEEKKPEATTEQSLGHNVKPVDTTALKEKTSAEESKQRMRDSIAELASDPHAEDEVSEEEKRTGVKAKEDDEKDDGKLSPLEALMGGSTEPEEDKAQEVNPVDDLEKSSDFKTLKTTYKTRLNEAMEQVKDLQGSKAKLDAAQAELDKVKSEIAKNKKVVEEVNQFKQKAKLLTEEEFINQIRQPREDIAAKIKSSLSDSGVPGEVWDQALQLTDKKELESLVRSKIDSELLRNEFYTSFFSDLELRNAEMEALSAPGEYLNNLSSEKQSQMLAQKAELEGSLPGIMEKAKKSAAVIAGKLGEDRIVELMEIPGNDKHNSETVKPILDTADKAAELALQERVQAGLPVDDETATKTYYLWRQAVAAQAVNKQRVEWFKKYQASEQRYKDLETKFRELKAKGNPGVTASTEQKKPASGYKVGNLRDNIAKLANESEG